MLKGENMFKALIPNESYNSIHDIDLISLYKKGYRNILIDVDNTILPWNSNEISANLRKWIKQSEVIGFSVFLFSAPYNENEMLVRRFYEKYNYIQEYEKEKHNEDIPRNELYLRMGIKEWQGNKDILINAGNKNLIDFVYSSELFKELREYFMKTNKTSIDNIITKPQSNE